MATATVIAAIIQGVFAVIAAVIALQLNSFDFKQQVQNTADLAKQTYALVQVQNRTEEMLERLACAVTAMTASLHADLRDLITTLKK